MNQAVQKDTKYQLEQIKEIIQKADNSRDQKLQKVCEVLSREEPAFDWVGFYIVDPDAQRELVLEPYAGAPTEHTRIAFGKVIYRQDAETNDTFVVQNVHEAHNYLSCKAQVRSEIVVLIKKKGKFIAELDIDSHTKNAIPDRHRNLLEKVWGLVSELF